MAERIIKAGDTFPPITTNLTLDGQPVDLTDADSVRMWMRTTLPGGGGNLHIHTDPCEIEDAVGGVVTYTPSPAETAVPGNYDLEWEVDWGEDDQDRPRIQTFPNDSYETLRIIEALDPPQGSGA